MLGFAETGQMGVDGRDGRTLVAEVDLDLPEVLALFQEMGRVTVAQTVNVRGLLDAADPQPEPEGPLQSGALDRFGGGGGALAAVTFGREEPGFMPMSLPLFSEQLEGALRQGDIAVRVAFARADVQEHALGIHVPNLEIQPFAQAEAARVDGAQTNAMIKSFDLGQNFAHFLGGENDGQFELRIGPDQLDFGGPGLAESFFPEKFDGANILSGSLARDFLFRFEMEEVLAEFFGRDQVGRFAKELAELAQARPVAQDGAFGQGQQTQVVEEAV
jgi:hypothetical protein